MKVHAFMTDFDLISFSAAVESVASWVTDKGIGCRYVVTPNVDHVIVLRGSPAFRMAYANASLRLIDGWPVALAIGFIFGVRPQVIPGSDFVPAIFDELQKRNQSARVFLLGGLPGVAEIAAESIGKRWPKLVIAGTYSPPFGFENDPDECDYICNILNEAKPDLLVLGLGAPKQELWIHRHQTQVGSCVAICAGATIDFLSGMKRRAPRWVRDVRMEWLYRVLQEPRRLFIRYARGVLLFPFYVLQEKFKLVSAGSTDNE